mmetsp:Transcript_39268/g.97021  ORF Transcript_39268/g.97021 Transcript_39268/m.97021 type:complete len:201 (-) Transcript_39268:204-806(-)
MYTAKRTSATHAARKRITGSRDHAFSSIAYRHQASCRKHVATNLSGTPLLIMGSASGMKTAITTAIGSTTRCATANASTPMPTRIASMADAIAANWSRLPLLLCITCHNSPERTLRKSPKSPPNARVCAACTSPEASSTEQSPSAASSKEAHTSSRSSSARTSGAPPSAIACIWSLPINAICSSCCDRSSSALCNSQFSN